MSIAVERSEHGQVAGQPVSLFTLTAPNGVVLRASELGATIVELHVPDRDGRPADVVLGLASIARYVESGLYFGCVVGRVANRIAGASFSLDGREHALTVNHGRHHLHGGTGGFSRAHWRGEVVLAPDGASAALRFSYRSHDGEDGYPGTLDASVVYRLVAAGAGRGDGAGAGEIHFDYDATVDRATIVNLSQHSYWNLAGHDARDILDHRLTLDASRYTPADAELIPTGAIAPVAGGPYDFTRERGIGDAIEELAASHASDPTPPPRGFDVNYVIDGEPPALRRAATLRHPGSGRVMEVWTTEPGIQLYTGNFLDGIAGKRGAVYGRHAALCLETQRFPDSIHHEGEPGWPSVVLRPGERYRHHTVHRFRVTQTG